MAAATYSELFNHVVIDRIISTVRSPNHRLSQIYGLQPGGSAVSDIGGEVFGWDIFDRTRKMSSGRLRNSGPATRKPNLVGTKTATVYRQYEQIPIEGDRIFRKRKLGGPIGALDVRGQEYITKQIGYQHEKFMNTREALTAFCFQGGFDLLLDGDDIMPVPVGSGDYNVDFGLPASNQGAVPHGGKDTFAGNWQDAVNCDPIGEFITLNKVAVKGSRYPIQLCWLDAEGAQYLLKSEAVNTHTGTANVITNEGQHITWESNNPERQLSNVLTFHLRGYPMIQFIVYDDEVLLDDGTAVPFIPPGKGLFTPAPSSEWIEWRNGSELVQERLQGPIREAYGMTMWLEPNRHPVSLSLVALDNGLPTPYVPQAWFWADLYTPA